MKAHYHYTDNYILNPQHLITVALIGVGGTGSQVLSSLARMNQALVSLGHPGLHVRVYDNDIVSEANIGRQMFSPADIGINKAISSVTRVNRFFGLNWEAHPVLFSSAEHTANIIVSCIDTAKGRIKIANVDQWSRHQEPTSRSIYWLDFGNLKVTGQVVLGTLWKPKGKKDQPPYILLPTVNDLFDLGGIKEEDQGPSCSLAEALTKQDLFINSTLANLGCNLLWKLFRDGKLDYHGAFLNLETMQVRPIKLA